MAYLVSILVFISVSAISAFISALAFNGLSKTLAFISLTIGIVFAVKSVVDCKDLKLGIDLKKMDFVTYFVIISFLLFISKSFLWLIYQKGSQALVTSPNNIGDICLHINHINYFADGIPFWPDSPIFSDSKLRYPIGIDLFNSLLVLTWGDLFRSLRLVGVVLGIVTGIAFLLWGRAFALAAFLFNGGLAGFAFLKGLHIADYQMDLAWKSLPLTVFIPQRGVLFAIPAGLILLCSLREKLFNAKNPYENSKLSLPLWIEVLLYSSMPFFHTHTFIYFSLLFSLWVLIFEKHLRDKILNIIKYSFIPASVLMFYLTDSFKASSIINIKIGWMQGNSNFFVFWLLNFGLFIPLVIYYFYSISTIRKNNITYFDFKVTREKAFVLPAILLFIFFCIVMLAPWDWDNVKLLMWSYFIITPFIWEKISNIKIVYKSLICFVLFFSGFICVLGGVDPRKSHVIYNTTLARSVKYAIKDIPLSDRFAAFPTYNHPLLINGRKVVYGYPGWIWSHGYSNYHPLENKLKKIMMGEYGWKTLAKEVGAKYIFWGPSEKEHYGNSSKPWAIRSRLVAQDYWGEIYSLDDEVNFR